MCACVMICMHVLRVRAHVCVRARVRVRVWHGTRVRVCVRVCV